MALSIHSPVQSTLLEQPLTCVYSVRSYLVRVDGEVFTSWLGLRMLNLPQKGSVPLTTCPVVTEALVPNREKKKKKDERLEKDSEDTSTIKVLMKIQEMGFQNFSDTVLPLSK